MSEIEKEQERVKQQMCGVISYLEQKVPDLTFVLIGVNCTDTPERGALDMTTMLCDEHAASVLKHALGVVEGRIAARSSNPVLKGE